LHSYDNSITNSKIFQGKGLRIEKSTIPEKELALLDHDSSFPRETYQETEVLHLHSLQYPNIQQLGESWLANIKESSAK